MPLFKSTLKLLADGQIHSQKEISHFLGIPFSIVPETLQRLFDTSIDLELDKKGYRIPGGLELLNEKLIFNELGNANQLLNHLEILSSIDSTNNYLLEKTADSKKYVVFAEQQTSGRGQFNRPWISNIGKNIALSILWYLPNDPNKLMGLSLVMGLAIVQTLEEYGLNGIKLKWPNDVVYQGKKLAGILIETRMSKSLSTVVIGIGLNLYKPSNNPNAIDQAVTDIYSIQKLPIQRNRFAGLLLKNSLITLSKFQVTGFSPFLEEWKKLDSLRDKSIYIQTSKVDTLEGVARGINAYSQLRVEIKGKIYCFHSGEIRINLKPGTENC